MNTDVVELPQQPKPLFRGSVGASTRSIAGQACPGMTRLSPVVSTPPLDHGSDAAMCVPSAAFGTWEEHATQVVADWEARWLLISSMPRLYRDEARAELLHAVVSALIAAAIDGVDSFGRPDDVSF